MLLAAPDSSVLISVNTYSDPRVTIHSEIQNNWQETFDFILAFEVLEHIEDDVSALREWWNGVKFPGHRLLSVPAHPERWNASDEWEGHFRRYEHTGPIETLGAEWV